MRNLLNNKKIITREEAAIVAVTAIEFLNGNLKDADIEFKDKNEVSEKSINEVSKALRIGIMTLYEDNTFKPKNTISTDEIEHLNSNLKSYLDVKNKTRRKTYE